MASVALAGAIALAGCNTDEVSPGARALRPLPPALVAEIEKKNMPRESPILVRIFKEESELEVWKQDAEGKFALLKIYPICRWSGELGPKIKEGDRQAPEGFYNITPGLMNPNSNYYLAFNLGFPNAYDKANDRTGAFLMVHGDCSSSGCYAMTDEQIQEIYALGRDAFMGGQKSFQVQAYPFRMTPLNMARHRNNPSMAFWRMIKEGNDHFEVTKAEPHIDVCEKHYVFDAETPPNATPITFHPRDKCPVYEISPEIAGPVKEKHERDERAFSEDVSRGVATVAVRTGNDGGMNPTFLAHIRPQEVVDTDGRRHTVAASSIPLPHDVNPPRAAETDVDPSESALHRVGRWFGISGGTETADAAPATTAATGAPKSKPVQAAATTEPTTKQASAAPATATRHAAATPTGASGASKQAAVAPEPDPAAKPAAKPATQVAQTHPQPPPSVSPAPPADGSAVQSASSGLIAGASPVVPSGSFEGRWGALR
jgi:murein L,D-transpeptidase YafK